jgi:hypothetical protein
MNPYAKAQQDFKGHADFRGVSDPVSLGAPREMRQYLENRLVWAFQIGVVAAELIAAKKRKRKAKR